MLISRGMQISEYMNRMVLSTWLIFTVEFYCTKVSYNIAASWFLLQWNLPFAWETHEQKIYIYFFTFPGHQEWQSCTLQAEPTRCWLHNNACACFAGFLFLILEHVLIKCCHRNADRMRTLQNSQGTELDGRAAITVITTNSWWSGLRDTHEQCAGGTASEASLHMM